MSEHSPLEQYRQDITRCARCGACRAVCPSFMPEREESLSARGRMALTLAVLDGRLPVSEIFRDRLATCTGCLACEVSCPSGVPVTEIIQAAKEEAVKESGVGIIRSIISTAFMNDSVMRSLAWLAPIVLHYAGRSVKGKEQGKTSNFKLQSSPDQGARGRIAFYPGCAVVNFQPDIGKAAIAVLNRLGYDVVIPEGIKCCGRPLLSLGDRKGAEYLAAQNTALLSALDADAVVTACASCGLTFKKEYPTLLAPSGKRPVPVLDIHEFLAGKVPELHFRPVDMHVTYHDPCHLGRGQGLSKTAKDMLRSIPGLTLIEMKNPDRCCGFGGVMRATHHDLSDRIGGKKAEDVIATGASSVVTGCPGCRMQIFDSLRRAGSKIEVVHTVQVVEAALRHTESKKKEVEKVGR